MDKLTETISIIRNAQKEDGKDVAVLFYSAGGKDSLVLLDILSKEYKKVVCIYLYLIRGLEHTQKYIVWAKRRYGAEVVAIPHYQRTLMKRNGFFCDPVEEGGFINQKEVEDFVRLKTGKRIIYNGTKGVDGYMKRMLLKMYGKQGYMNNQGVCFPLAKWTNKECLSYIRKNDVISPFVYNEKTTSQGFSIEAKELLCLREKFPNDYKKALMEFPYCEKIIFDYENHIKTIGNDFSETEFTSLRKLQPKKNIGRGKKTAEKQH